MAPFSVLRTGGEGRTSCQSEDIISLVSASGCGHFANRSTSLPMTWQNAADCCARTFLVLKKETKFQQSRPLKSSLVPSKCQCISFSTKATSHVNHLAAPNSIQPTKSF